MKIKAVRPALQLQRVTLLLDSVQVTRLKHRAVDDRASASDVVRRAVEDYLSRGPRSEQEREAGNG